MPITVPPLLKLEFLDKPLNDLADYFHDLATTGGATTTDGVRLSPGTLRAVHDHIKKELAAPEQLSGIYYPSSPVVSLLQSAMHDQLARKRTVAEAGTDEEIDEEEGQPFTDKDLKGWVGDVGLSLLGRLLLGPHRWCDTPAQLDLGERARLIMMADWGTGRSKARDVAEHAREHMAADDGRSVHALHLGDTYYSGTPGEARRNVLGLWPVHPGEEGTVGSWALNGNHDMYSGGHGLFETTLMDPRFARQRVNGDPTSWLHLTTQRWNILGLDTSWLNHLLWIETNGELTFSGKVGHLEPPQIDTLAQCLADDRRLLVLSHHQLFSAYDDRNHEPPMQQALADTLRARPIDVWFWGHEHFCMGYDAHCGVNAARVIGNGAVPTNPLPGDTTPVDDNPAVGKPVLGANPTPALSAVRWQYTGSRAEADGEVREKHAFVVVDLDDDQLHAEYFDDEGQSFWSEDL